ncbi:MAG: c-type cytochrome [Alphaproteobacteria bacterium]|nr:c-type cytochrome [Alphaproteobacteria bacterium]
MTPKKPFIGSFLTVVLTLLVIYAFIKWGIPAASREITSLPFPLPVPGTLMFFYMVLTVIALFLYVTFSEEGLTDFLRPVKKLLRGGYTKILRAVVLTAIPAVIGWQVYEIVVPKVEVPSSLRIQHPSSNFPKSFEAKKNPFSEPTEAQVDAFIEQAKADEVVFIPQVQEDIDRWSDETEPDHVLAFFPGDAMKKLVSQIEGDDVDKAVAKAALLEKNLFEGRALYAMNCRACHGDSVAGDGPMADGFKLRPIDFTDNGTIETIVEGYTFWRVTNGGPGLPTEATPWDSAMPEWKLSLTEEQRWQIILAEYNLAQKTPRIPESH